MKRRKGQSLLIMILMLIALAGILAMTLDFGSVILARRQMQTSVNAAALEGAKTRDVNGLQHAREIILNINDDDFDPDENRTTVGAGIDSSLIQPIDPQRTVLADGTSARDLYVNRHRFTFRPDPQLNEGNAAHGD